MVPIGSKNCSFKSMLLGVCLLSSSLASEIDATFKDLSAALVTEITGEKLMSQVCAAAPVREVLDPSLRPRFSALQRTDADHTFRRFKEMIKPWWAIKPKH